MTAFVLDCSIAVSWCFDDEATPATDALFDRLVEETAVVPGIWPLELGNVLLMAERRGRISPARLTEFMAVVDDLSIVVDEATSQRALGAVLSLARHERLTTYDATYLELAMRLGIALATKDAELRDAAARQGTSVLGT